MSTLSEPPKESFRLSMLIYDTRYRSLTIQTVAMILLVLMISWLVSNTVQNLENLGKDFDFGFLGQRAGYDINQRLVEYTSQSTHARAALVGILNTILVAFLGCALATILGVIAGVLRLSKNWLVSRLMAVYVEGFRNVPLLLWIIAIFALMTESTPMPRDFREGGDASMLFGSIAISNRGVYVPAPVWGEGASLLIGVFVISLIAIWAFRRYAHRRQEATGDILPVFRVSLALFFIPVLLTYFAIAFANGRTEQAILATGGEAGLTLTEYAESQESLNVCLIPGTTTALNLEKTLRGADVRYNAVPFNDEGQALEGFQVGDCNVLSVPATQSDPIIAEAEGGFAPVPLVETIRRGNALEFEQPYLGGFNFDGGIHLRNSLIALWLALSLYTGAFIAEIVRGGILSVSKGQTEAAYALGLRPNRTMNLVILPQAMRVIIPPLISQYLNLTKNSSLAIAVGYMDVRSTLGGITINQTGRELEGMLLLGLFYLVLSLLISGAMNFYNSRVKLKER
ncbi:ABC transporter permease subunit [Tranquillimonas alkanivorans]|uniref:Amine acid ABC transporter, permease protein, 3-TM region, His/Glu/Gln/Arg/opine family n=1 Tax=Tranquillimonas alkanivorans TaxID=441119 RepID=A0A1I5SXD6_9RHOB|nr:ABC transporter permease subunit [Tranquillimonas alkanivorans]SFP75410.1 amine acid ABC transporter, permease protein, 3-TM region, His/Glu/Gln/Arg/opine family [Tranquillimonas alkanivorans]